MQLAFKILRAGVAVVGAGALSIVLFVRLGVVLAVGAMMAIYGRSEVQDAPAHGGAILFATLPIAGIISIPAFMFLTVIFYRIPQSGRLRKSEHLTTLGLDRPRPTD